MGWIKKIRNWQLQREIKRFEMLKAEALKTDNEGLLKRIAGKIPFHHSRWTNNNSWGEYSYSIELPDGYTIYSSDSRHEIATANIIEYYIDRLKEKINKP